ncbi:MAG TPA: 30S ribosomal protein S6 [Candidatus Paceibacterota bacterium]
MSEQTSDSNRYYEIGFVITPSIEEGNALTVSKEMRALISKHGGNVIDGEEPRLRRLAYPIYKVIGGQKIAAVTGFFGWTKFEIDSEESSNAIPAIEKGLKDVKEIIRFLLVKTAREKTYSPREPEQIEEIFTEETLATIPKAVEIQPSAEDSREGKVVEAEKEE